MKSQNTLIYDSFLIMKHLGVALIKCENIHKIYKLKV